MTGKLQSETVLPSSARVWFVTSMMVLLLVTSVLLLTADLVTLVRGNNHLLNFLDASTFAALLLSDEPVVGVPVSELESEAFSALEGSVVDPSVLDAWLPDELSPLFAGSEVVAPSDSDVPVAEGLSVVELSVGEAPLSDVFSGFGAPSVVDGSALDDASGSETSPVLVASGLNEDSVGDSVSVGSGEAALVVSLTSLGRS